MLMFYGLSSICNFIGFLISSVVLAVILSMSSAFVLKLLVRLIGRFKVSYVRAYFVSFLSWFAALAVYGIVSLVSDHFEVVETRYPSPPHSVRYESIYPPGVIPISIYISILLAWVAVSLIYSAKIEDPDIGPIGLGKGFLIASSHVALFILFVISVMGYITFLGP